MEKNDSLGRLSEVVLNSLDANYSTEELSRRAYKSRTQFHRLFRALVEETPAAMRRRLLLERAAFQLKNARLPLRRLLSTQTTALWKLSPVPFGKHSECLPVCTAECAQRTSTYRQKTEFTSWPRVPS